MLSCIGQSPSYGRSHSSQTERKNDRRYRMGVELLSIKLVDPGEETMKSNIVASPCKNKPAPTELGINLMVDTYKYNYLRHMEVRSN